jgi:hypothetical protein
VAKYWILKTISLEETGKYSDWILYISKLKNHILMFHFDIKIQLSVTNTQRAIKVGPCIFQHSRVLPASISTAGKRRHARVLIPNATKGH